MIDDDDDRWGFDPWDEDPDNECGWFELDDGWCSALGSEHCDFVCPLRWSRRQAGAHARARARRRSGRGVGPDRRRFGFRAAWAIRRRARRWKEP